MILRNARCNNEDEQLVFSKLRRRNISGLPGKALKVIFSFEMFLRASSNLTLCLEQLVNQACGEDICFDFKNMRFVYAWRLSNVYMYTMHG